LVKAETRCDICEGPPLITSISQPDVTHKYYILNTETAILRNVGIFL